MKRPRKLALLALWVTLAALTGCGAGSSSLAPRPGGGGDGGGQPTTKVETGTARFDVDVTSGDVVVTPLEASSRAVFAGSAVTFNSSQLIDQAGNTGIRMLEVSLTNRWGARLGQLPDGSTGGLRVQFGPISQPDTTVNLSINTKVEDAAVSAAVMGLAAASPTTLYASSGHAIYRLEGQAWRLWAGGSSAGSTDNSTVLARFNGPRGVAINPADGALFVADTGNQRIRRIDSKTLRVTTVAGSTAGSDNGSGAVAKFTTPASLAFRGPNDLLVSCLGDGSVRRVVFGSGSVSAPTSYTVSNWATGLSAPDGLAISPTGDVYVAESGANRITQLPFGVSNPVIAGATTAGNADGTGLSARFRAPRGLTWVDGGLVVGEFGGHRLRRLTLAPGSNPQQAANWTVKLLAGSATGASGNDIGSGTSARFKGPLGLTSWPGGTVWVADYNNGRVRRVLLPQHALVSGDGGSTNADRVKLSNPSGYYPAKGTIERPYIDYGASVLDDAWLAPGQTTKTLEWWFAVPVGVNSFSFVATVEAAPSGPAVVPAKTGGGSPEVMVTTLAGGLTAGARDGLATFATLAAALPLAADNGLVFLSQQAPYPFVRAYDGNQIARIAGGGWAGTDGSGDVAGFGSLGQMAFGDDRETLYVTDRSRHTIRKLVQPTGSALTWWTATTLAGQDNVSGYQDGASLDAKFVSPTAVLKASNRFYYVVDGYGGRVRTLSYVGTGASNASGWRVDFLAGDGLNAVPETGRTDGTGTTARFNSPVAVAVDASNYIYVADRDNQRIRRISPAGVVTTVAGTGVAGSTDGPGHAASFSAPSGIAVGPGNELYVTDASGHMLRRIDRVVTASSQ